MVPTRVEKNFKIIKNGIFLERAVEFPFRWGELNGVSLCCPTPIDLLRWVPNCCAQFILIYKTDIRIISVTYYFLPFTLVEHLNVTLLSHHFFHVVQGYDFHGVTGL